MQLRRWDDLAKVAGAPTPRWTISSTSPAARRTKRERWGSVGDRKHLIRSVRGSTGGITAAGARIPRFVMP